ncbi:MAG TPA: helix-turn-helix domain-containing protein [Pyrinomonadaceae bacterium]|jgi:AraC-like DNA-binding protein|nr:helix-turn-helix domain-containing protein [Pyrinomonadaceae bacterium]
MEPSLDVLAVLNLLGAAQGLFLSVMLLGVKGGNRVANRILATLVATIALFVTGAVVRTSHYEFVVPHLSRIHDPLPFLAVPLIFLYVRKLTARTPSFHRREFLHFIPFILCCAYLLPYYLQGREAKLAFLMSEYHHPSLGSWYYVRSALIILQAALYLALTVLTILAFARESRKQNSSADKAVLFQIRFFVTGFLVLFAGGLLRYLLDHTAKTNLLVPFGASVFVYALGYVSFRNPQALARTDEPPQAKKYEWSTLTPETSERYLRRLLQAMKDEKLYLDAELTVSKLAEKLSIPPPHLSQTINERLNQNFVDFINTYRVEEAKRKLLDPLKRHYSVLAIAEEAGFNSKSSFNSVFKKHTRMTPSEYRKASGDDGRGRAGTDD